MVPFIDARHGAADMACRSVLAHVRGWTPPRRPVARECCDRGAWPVAERGGSGGGSCPLAAVRVGETASPRQRPTEGHGDGRRQTRGRRGLDDSLQKKRVDR
jgi:hypothetical protein